MVIGRILFGVGGESLFVSQTRTTTSWFRGKELAFALGVNLGIARLGSVLNDYLSPILCLQYSMAAAMYATMAKFLFKLHCNLGGADF